LHWDKTRRILVEVAEIVRTTDNCLVACQFRETGRYGSLKSPCACALDHVASGIVNASHGMMRIMAAVHRVADCIIGRVIPQATGWQRIGDKIDKEIKSELGIKK